MQTRQRVTLAAAALAVAAALSPLPLDSQSDDLAVVVSSRPASRRVDVTVGGRPFTSYLYPASLEKPVLHPIRSAAGREVTRGYPLAPRPGERADHPHHVGHWFNYGDVNGYDFWGHSTDTPPANKPRMGTIVHRAIVEASSGASSGTLAVRADWIIPDGTTLLRETTRFVFSGAQGRRSIDRTTTWTAAVPVTFNDTKEGAFAIRVARALDHPSAEPEPLLGADGRSRETRRDPKPPTGRYVGPAQRTGEQVWGTRGPWMGLTGVVEGAPVTLAIFDHPSNHGHPTYWHARGYGLFAANPLGRRGYDPAQPPATLTLRRGQSLTFQHRILVLDGHLGGDQLAREFAHYVRAPAR